MPHVLQRAVFQRAATLAVVLGLLLTGLVTVGLATSMGRDHADQVDRATDALLAALHADLHALESSLIAMRDTATTQALAHPADHAVAHPVLHDWPIHTRELTTTLENGFAQGTIPLARAVALFRHVDRRALAAYENAISDRDGVDVTVHPTPTDRAYVVERVVPSEPNSSALGFDLASEPRRLLGIEGARDTGLITVSAAVELVVPDDPAAVILFVPTYRTGDIPPTVDARREEFVGGLLAAVEPAALIERGPADALGLDVQVWDLGPGAGGSIEPTLLVGDPSTATISSARLEVAGRTWEVRTAPTPAFARTNRWPVVALGVAGLLLTIVIAVLGHVLRTREASAQVQVEVRTADLRRSQAELEAANEELRRTDQSRTEFLVTVSHELRTPLTSIRGFASLLEHHSHELSEEDRKDFVGQLARGAESMSDLLQEVLEFARLEHEQPPPVTMDLDLERLLDDVIERLPFANRIDVTIDGSAPTASGDPVAVRRALHNVLDNAASYSPEDAPVHVRVRPAAGPDMIEIVVDDHGPGVAPDDRERVFQRFHRGHDAQAGTVAGTGIGLTLARAQLERMEGRIHLEDAPGGGARVVIGLPCAQVRAARVDEMAPLSP
ncbi:Osmosensitive K+ channel histidine kinase KdpD [Euzebya pacifica]|uniref:histidine kinase n=1 Tax=Euzebya pacifica TaxID=1608957 RepID=A0A346XTL8_9ACTN|nr:CHASE domain-containing protein [Euzebya pacifica]AXV05565.1 Osmosensitive K+ channel histidine kinase KdpD [Euzebya pacifica]